MVSSAGKVGISRGIRQLRTDDAQQRAIVGRFLKESTGSHLQSLLLRTRRIACGQYDDWNVGQLRVEVQPFEYDEAIAGGQPQVQNDEIWFFLFACVTAE